MLWISCWDLIGYLWFGDLLTLKFEIAQALYGGEASALGERSEWV